MYLEHFGLSREPFAEQPDAELFFPDADRISILRKVYADLQNGCGVVRVIGSEGTGKTMLCLLLAHLLPAEFRTVHLTTPLGSFDELLRAVCLELGIGQEQDKLAGLHVLLERHGQEQKKVLLILDEAEKMFPAALERLLRTVLSLDRSRPLQVVLAGRPVLDDHVGQLHAHCSDMQLSPSHMLEPLTEAETAAYLGFRLNAVGMSAAESRQLFSDGAVRRIFEQSGGNLRLVHALADKAMQRACAADRALSVQAVHVPGPSQALGRSGTKRSHGVGQSSRRLKLAMAAVVLLALAWLLLHFDQQGLRRQLQDLAGLFSAGQAKPELLLPIPEKLLPTSEEQLPDALGAADGSAESGSEGVAAAEPSDFASKYEVLPAESERRAAAGEPPAEQTEAAALTEEPLHTPPSEVVPSAADERNDPSGSLERPAGQSDKKPEPAALTEEPLHAPPSEVVPSAADERSDPSGSLERPAGQSDKKPEPAALTEEPLHAPPSEVVPSAADERNDPSGSLERPAGQSDKKPEPAAEPDVVSAKPAPGLSRPAAQAAAKPAVARPAAAPEKPIVLPARKIVHLAPRSKKSKAKPPAESSLPRPKSVQDSSGSPNADQLYLEFVMAGTLMKGSRQAGRHTIQLLTLSSQDAAAKIKEMIVRDEYLEHRNQLQILRRKTAPAALFVFYGSYASMEEAKAALDDMPLFLRKHHPYALSVAEALKKSSN